MIEIPLFYRDGPIFGFDLGYNSLKVMQIDTLRQPNRVVGYGFASFDPKLLSKGAVKDPEGIAKAAYELFTNHLVGTIDTKRVVAALPVAQTFVRVLSMPRVAKENLDAAVKVEVEQYLPVATDELYLDYELGEPVDKEQQEVLVVAAPKKIVDSYLTLFGLLGLELAALETTISASTRLVKHAEGTDLPTLMIDFGSVSTDLAIFDKTLRVTGAVAAGGDTITATIANKLGLSQKQAHIVKTRHGLSVGKHQQHISKAIEPMLENLVNEIKRMVRFYQERSGTNRKLEQVIIVGGGANMPGLAEFLTDKLRMATRTADPWLHLDFGRLQPPHQLEKTLYATAAGLALLDPRTIHR